jgi:hypothetical protein
MHGAMNVITIIIIISSTTSNVITSVCTLTSFVVQYTHCNVRNVTVLPHSYLFLIALKTASVLKRYIEHQLVHLLLHDFLSKECYRDKCVVTEA